MDSLDSPRSNAGLSGATSTEREIQTLRLTLQITLAALVILAGSISILIFRQVSLLRRQVEATTRQAQYLAQVFNTSFGPQSQAFEKRLQELAESDPELKARIARFYGPPDATNAPTAPSQPGPTTATEPAPPKP